MPVTCSWLPVCIQALSEICVAIKLVRQEQPDLEHPLDRSYHSLGCELHPLESNSPDFQVSEDNEKTPPFCSGSLRSLAQPCLLSPRS